MNEDLAAMHTNQALAGRFSAIQPTLIERQREIEHKETEIRKVFDEIDRNRDGKVAADELLAYLDQRSEGEFDRDITDQLFKRLDQDMDGKVTIEEFIATYLDAEENLKTKITENIKIMADHTRQRDEIRNKITEAKVHPPPPSRSHSLDRGAHHAVRHHGRLDPHCQPGGGARPRQQRQNSVGVCDFHDRGPADGVAAH